jgi:hypothetical protein
MTYLYYLVFYMMINITSSDEVLHTSQRDFNTGSPVWSLIIILVASLVYCLGIVYMINFCFKNYRDMGMEVYGMIAHSTTERLKSGVNGIRADLGKKASQDAAAQKQNEKTGTEEGNANKKKGGSKGGGNIDVSVTTEASYDPKTKKFTTTSKYNASTKSAARNDEKSTYNEKANEKGSADANIASDIDSKIKKGAEQGAEQAAKAEKAESSGDKKSSK